MSAAVRSAPWRTAATVAAVGVIVVAAWVTAGRLEDRVSGDGERSAIVVAHRVRPFDPAQPSAEFQAENASNFRVPTASHTGQSLLAWSFVPVPRGWKRLGVERAHLAAGGSAFVTSAAKYEVQMESSVIDLSAGAYEVVLDGEVEKGGLQLLVTASTGQVLARGLYWSGAERKANEEMTIDLRLDIPTQVSISLANWAVDGTSSRWKLRRLTLYGRAESASLIPRRPLPLRPELSGVVDELRSTLRSTESRWNRATLVRDRMRDALPQTDTPAKVATDMWVVASHLGVPVRLVRTAANALNEFDSYVTTEVWLEDEGRWVVLDAYFGGHWTVGRTGQLLGVADIARLVRAGREDRIFWHGAPTARALSPTRHYVDPLQLHAYYAVLVELSGRPVYVGGTTAVPAGVTAYSTHDDVKLATADPHVGATVVPSAGVRESVTRRPPPATDSTGRFPYADEVLLEQTFAPRHKRGRSRMTIVLDASSYGYVTVSPLHRFTLTTAGVTYELAQTAGGRMASPIALLRPRMTLEWRNLKADLLTIRAWSTKSFPPGREIRSATPSGDG